MKGGRRNKDKINEAKANYLSNRIIVSTVADLEEQDRKFTANLTVDQRMEYLQKLINITHSEEDLLGLEKIFYDGRINIRKSE